MKADDLFPSVTDLVISSPLSLAIVAIGCLLGLSFIARACRVPVSVGLVRGFRGVGVPLACILLLIYGVCAFMTVRQEDRANRVLNRIAHHRVGDSSALE